jgi:aminoglycoside 6-adenylyltransferase
MNDQNQFALFESIARADERIRAVTLEGSRVNPNIASDPLIRVLLDKDGLYSVIPAPSDELFWVSKPSQECFDDCCNEFWCVSTYVVKGLLRKQQLFVNWHIEHILRVELLRMLGWYLGAQNSFPFNAGKHDRNIPKYLEPENLSLLLSTYRLDSLAVCKDAFDSAIALFRQASQKVAEALGYHYPDYDVNVSKYNANAAICSVKDEE